MSRAVGDTSEAGSITGAVLTAAALGAVCVRSAAGARVAGLDTAIIQARLPVPTARFAATGVTRDKLLRQAIRVASAGAGLSVLTAGPRRVVVVLLLVLLRAPAVLLASFPGLGGLTAQKR